MADNTDALADPTPEELRASQQAWVRRAIIAWAVVGIGLIGWAGLLLFLKIGEALAPLIVGMIIAFLVRPILRMLMGWRLPRGLAVAVTFLGLVVVVGVGMWFLIPLVFGNLTQFFSTLPQYWNQIQHQLSSAADAVKSIPPSAQNAMNQLLSSVGQTVQQVAGQIVGFIVAAGGGAMGIMFNVFLGLILAIWFSLDGERIASWVVWVVPARWRCDAVQIGHAFTDSFGGYIRGTIINMTITFALCAVGFWIIGLPYGWALALVVGVLDVIPYIGPILGGIMAGVIGLIAGGPIMGVLALAVVIAAEQAVDSVISPIVMGDAVSLHPVAIILALGIGGALAGFFGILVSIPVAAALYTVYLYYRGKIDPDFDNERTDPFVPTDPDEADAPSKQLKTAATAKTAEETA
jgi:predicted PurR-regulated permease PerM